jgi:membrane associated rhomboid family serine protease
MIPIRNAVPSRYPQVMAWILIAINCLVFLFQDSLTPDELELFLRQFAPARYSEAFASRETDRDAADILPFSMMFLHGGWLHLILNMWTLWLFGPTIEDRMGHARYLALLSGLRPCRISRARHVQPDFDRARVGRLRRNRRHSRLLHAVVSDGAGGGRRPILFNPLFFEVNAFVFIGLWFLIQVLQSMMALLLQSASGDIARWAHVGGIIAGFALGPFPVRSERRYRAYYPDEGVFGFDTKGRI